MPMRRRFWEKALQAGTTDLVIYALGCTLRTDANEGLGPLTACIYHSFLVVECWPVGTLSLRLSKRARSRDLHNTYVILRSLIFNGGLDESLTATY